MKFEMRVPNLFYPTLRFYKAPLPQLGYLWGLGLAEDGIRYLISLPTLLGGFGLGFNPKKSTLDWERPTVDS